MRSEYFPLEGRSATFIHTHVTWVHPDVSADDLPVFFEAPVESHVNPLLHVVIKCMLYFTHKIPSDTHCLSLWLTAGGALNQTCALLHVQNTVALLSYLKVSLVCVIKGFEEILGVWDILKQTWLLKQSPVAVNHRQTHSCY